MPTLVVGMPRSSRTQKHAHVKVGMAPDYPKSDATPAALSNISQIQNLSVTREHHPS